MFVSTKSKADIPETYLETATCKKAKPPSKRSRNIRKNNYNIKSNIEIQSNEKVKLNNEDKSSVTPPKRTKPIDVELSLRSRERTISTQLGKVNLRWDAAAEQYFGVGIFGIVLSSFNAASRVLSEYSFPKELRIDNYNWQIVIMDNVPVDIDIHTNGVGVCHPGWMRPPADIFIVGRRIATRCGKKLIPEKAAIKSLSDTLTHEIGHSIEYSFLGPHYKLQERWHQEGFATWFETLASRFTSHSSDNKDFMSQQVKYYWKKNWDLSSFKGTYGDYVRGYAMIATIADKRKVSDLQKVYKYASHNNTPIMYAIENHLGWSQKQLSNSVSHNFELKR